MTVTSGASTVSWFTGDRQTDRQTNKQIDACLCRFAMLLIIYKLDDV